jgi:hypothetical protein
LVHVTHEGLNLLFQTKPLPVIQLSPAVTNQLQFNSLLAILESKGCGAVARFGPTGTDSPFQDPQHHGIVLIQKDKKLYGFVCLRQLPLSTIVDKLTIMSQQQQQQQTQQLMLQAVQQQRMHAQQQMMMNPGFAQNTFTGQQQQQQQQQNVAALTPQQLSILQQLQNRPQ